MTMIFVVDEISFLFDCLVCFFFFLAWCCKTGTGRFVGGFGATDYYYFAF
jgi:hypothetical protein